MTGQFFSLSDIIRDNIRTITTTNNMGTGAIGKQGGRDMSYRLAADVGGTFTDVVLINDETGIYKTTKS